MKRLLFLIVFVLLIFAVAYNQQGWSSWGGSNWDYMAEPDSNIVQNSEYITYEWTSEEWFGPGRAQGRRYDCDNFNRDESYGYNGFIVYNNDIYMGYVVPRGPVYDHSVVNYLTGVCGADKVKLQQWYIDADDVIICINGSTGKTKWKRVFQSKGLYNGDYSKSRETNGTVVASEGKIYHLGTTGRFYCVDANTGDVVYETAGNSGKENEKTTALSTGEWVANEDAADNIVTTGMICVDSVVIIADYTNIVARSVKNGAVIWSKNGVNGRQATPVVSVLNGKKYVFFGSEDGKVRCVDPKTGAEKWVLTGVGHNRSSIVVKDGYMFLNVEGELAAYKTDAVKGCYRVTETGATFLWKDTTGITSNAGLCPVIYKGKVYYYLTEKLQLICANVATGQKLSYLPFDGTHSLMYVIDDKLLIDYDALHTSNSCFAYDISTDIIRFLFTYQPPHLSSGSYSISWPFPIVNGKMYLRGYNHFFCYNWKEKINAIASVAIANSVPIMSPGGIYYFTSVSNDNYGVNITNQCTTTWRVIGTGTITSVGKYTASLSPIGNDLVICESEYKGLKLSDTITVKFKTNQTINCHKFDSIYYLHPTFKLSCLSSSGLPVTYTKVSGPFILIGDSIKLLGAPGNCFVNVMQAGNDEFFAATSVLLKFYSSFSIPDDQITTDGSISIAKSYEFVVAPNPVKDLLYVYYSNPIIEFNELVNVKIIGINGDIKQNSMLLTGKNILQVEDLAPGVYIIIINGDVRKFIKI